MRGATRPWRQPGHWITISIHTPHAGSDLHFVQLGAHGVISIHTPHAGSDMRTACWPMRGPISIHTPHAGSDRGPHAGPGQGNHFNPHSPCGERLQSGLLDAATAQFQSTLPMRGATTSKTTYEQACAISIHTPHAGSDALILTADSLATEFQSTLPMRGATRKVRVLCGFPQDFNPHSPCGERRPPCAAHRRWYTHFNPHSPCGERLCA